ncbi:hypothetical protein [Nonomuraea angiospora]|uniref:hypothetical protein n=1 Tax=Nonomuraea angiospora TaxID=46172 RepID=UPI0029A27F5E|nr:hypothetical protein [Nonomuraea angiospora]MDX3111726.1 hypothetical protein [Nonomuraea angiospora]
MITHPPRLTRAHATPLLLPAPAGHPCRTVLVLTDDGRLTYATQQAVLDGETGRIVLTRAELLDAEIRVLPGTGGRLASGCGPGWTTCSTTLTNGWPASSCHPLRPLAAHLGRG